MGVIDPVLVADHPENVPLWLPSDLLRTSHNAQDPHNLFRLEYELRYAQASHALHEIRHFRRLSQVITKKKKSHLGGLKTRASGLEYSVKTRLNTAISTYRAAQTAVLSLNPQEEFGVWKKSLLKLDDSHLRGPGRESTDSSNSSYVQSWIWTTSSQTSACDEDPDLQVTLRIEWCKVHERANRFNEERQLVAEEM